MTNTFSGNVFDVTVDLIKPDQEVPEGQAQLAISVDENTKKLTFIATKDGNTERKEFSLVDIEQENGVLRAEVTGLTDFFGLNLGATAQTFDKVKMALRLDTPDNGWTTSTPYFTLLFCGDLTGSQGTTFELSDGAIGAGVAFQFQTCAGLALIAPPDEAGGISNLAVRLDLPDFGVSSGWLPLSILDLGQLSDFHMPGVLDWFARLLNVDFGDYKLSLDWNLDLPFEFQFPFGIRAKEASFELRKAGTGTSDYRVQLRVEGLVFTWNDEPALTYDDFLTEVIWDGNTYKVSVRLVQAQYPEVDGADRYGFALPFGLLDVSAKGWFLKLGIFAHQDNGEWRVCFDTLLEIADLQIKSIDSVLYNTDIRLHLRDLRALSAKPTNPITMFSQVETQVDVFADYATKPIPQLTFAQDLFAPPGAPNDYGVEILDGDIQPDTRMFLAWKQSNVSRMFKALMHDLIGTAPAGALPADTEMVELALEIAWFDGAGARDMQIRLDMRAAAPDTTGAANLAWPTVQETCFDLAQLGKGIVLPGGTLTSTDTLDKATTGQDAFSIGLPGIDLSVRRPEVHSLVLRREGDGTDSLSWIVSWGAKTRLEDGKALAEASLDFAFTKPGGERQVQPGKDGKLFRVVLGARNLGGNAPDARSIKLIGWREDEGISYLHPYVGEGAFAILPPATDVQTNETGCPPPAVPVQAPVALDPTAFQSFTLGASSPYVLGLSVLGAVNNEVKALLSQFGDDRGVEFSIEEVCLTADKDALIVKTELSVALSSSKNLTGSMDFRLSLSDLSLSVEDGAELGLRQEIDENDPLPKFIDKLNKQTSADTKLVATKKIDLFGFDLYGVTEVPKDEKPKEIELLSLSMEDGQFTLMVPNGTQLLMRYDAFGDDGLTFSVDKMVLGAGGLDLNAALLATTLKLPGLQKPFSLEEARLEIVGGRMTDLTISGSGQLPELLNNAPVSIALSLQQTPGGDIRLADFDCDLGDGETPIFSRGTRCKFEITKITIDMDDAGGTKPQAWFFRISGSVQMQPEGSELLGNLLEDFKSIRLEFTDAPLGDEFFEHVELIATLNQPETFPVLGLFDMEVRSIGFHPKFTGFKEPSPAIIIGGQIAFADIGDVLSVEVDFHKLYIGLPEKGEIIPQVHAKGLGVEISTSGFKIAGRVEYYNSDLIDGFAGEGTVLIPGLPELSAAFSFVKMRADTGDTWKRGWFIAIEAARISFQIGPLPLYLRQIGLGFGYRYTSVLIKKFESEDRLGPLIELMLREISNHHSLARIASWAPDPERDGQSSRWSIGLEAMFSMASANSSPTTYNVDAEKQLKSVIAQLLLFLRSDLTFMAASKLWFPVSADDFFEDREGMRKRPLALGFMAYSAPKSRLLIHAAKGKNPYLGPKKEETELRKFLAEMLDNSHFEATFLSEPGLIHAELGWPDRLFFKYKIGALTIECRGGVLFRLEKDMLVQGVYFSARGDVTVSSGLSLGIVGTHISAHISVSFGMRLMIGISLSRPLDSNIYAAVGIDVSVRFAVHIWFRLKLKFFKISIDIHFALEIQIVIALEIGWAGQGNLGFRAQASVMISAFGRGLKVKVNVSAGNGVEGARQALSPYMRSFLEPGAIPPIPGIEFNDREQVLIPIDGGSGAPLAAMPLAPPGAPPVAAPPVGSPGAIPPPAGVVLAAQPAPAFSDTPLIIEEAERAEAEKASFVFALRQGRDRPNQKKLWFGWIMPSPVAEGKETRPLYPPVYHSPSGDPELRVNYGILRYPKENGVTVYRPSRITEKTFQWVKSSERVDGDGLVNLPLDLHPFARANLTPEGGGVTEALTLQQFLAACYVPKDASDFGSDGTGGVFPTNWSGFDLAAADLGQASKRLRDERLDAPTGDVLSTRRGLDADHPYDRALMDAIDASEKEGDDKFLNNRAEDEKRAQLREQALGNQSFLFRSFLDDFTWIAERTRPVADGVPVTEAFATSGRPTLIDLGMVVCVESDTCPDWLCRFPDEGEEPLADLKISAGVPQQTWHVDTQVPPVIDFADANFALSPPDMAAGPSYADDEVLVFIWDIDWRKVPGSVFKGENGQGPEIEDFLSHYKADIYEAGTDRLLDAQDLNPCDMIAPDKDGKDDFKRLKTRFQYVKKIEELSIDRQRLLRGSIKFRARIVPFSQDGSEGEPLELSATHKPSATPLPADGATLRLEFPNADNNVQGDLYWRQPTPPNDPAVALTNRWELILRPINPLPLGAYPAETAEADDSALTSFRASGLKDGDIIVAFDAKPFEGDAEKIWPETGETDATDTAKRLMLPLNQGWEETATEYKAELFDHRGQRLAENNNLRKLGQGFFDHAAATAQNGAGWRLFLRASSTEDVAPGTLELPAEGYGSMVLVTLLLAVPPERQAVVDDEDEQDPVRFRALDYLEWPKIPNAQSDPPKLQVANEDLRAKQGALARAAIGVGTGGALQLHYQTQPGTDRAVTLTWNAVPQAGGKLEDTARYVLYEARMDRLVKLDREEDTEVGFGVDWTEIKEVKLTDKVFSGRVVTSFVQPEVWDVTPPVRRATLVHLQDMPPDQMQTIWPGWYSWADSDLRWPAESKETLDMIRGIEAAAQKAPLLQLKELLTNDELTPVERTRRELTALYALGSHAARRHLHPWLTCVLGELVREGAPPALGGNDAASVFEIEIAPGKPGPGTAPDQPGEDPGTAMGPQAQAEAAMQWMQNDLEDLDPTGWGALSHLGLAATIAMRDPATGVYLPQSTLRDQIADAVIKVNETAAAADESNVFELSMDLSHVAFDLPIQTNAGQRTAPEDRALDDAATLSMVQISLRPVPQPYAGLPLHPAYRYSVLEKEQALPEAAKNKVRLPENLDVIFPDQNRQVRRFESGQELEWRDILGNGEKHVLMRWTYAANSPFDWLVAQWALQNAGATFPYKRLETIESQPIAAIDDTETALKALRLTPFGNFDIDVKKWKNYFGLPYHGGFDRFAAFVAKAFMPEVTLVEAKKALRETEKFIETYIGWSARFFAAAPMTLGQQQPANADDLCDPSRLTAASPKRQEPAILAADDLGRLSFTHPVKEDWATLRSYAIMRVPRYWDLMNSGRPIVRPGLGAQDGRTDVALPRCRKVVPPKLIGLRVVTDPKTDRHFHEVTFSEHVEQALSKSNAALARKLEFQDTGHHYPISFRFVDWLEKLEKKGFAQPADLKTLTEGEGTLGPDAHLPPADLGTDDYLTHVPMARFGARRSLVAAEPFYYQQKITSIARAVDVKSLEVTTDLPKPPAAPASPFGASPVDWSELTSWGQLGLYTKEVTAKAWRVSIEAYDPDLNEDLGDLLLKPLGHRARIRFPRLMEMLPPESLTRHFTAETKAGSFGHIPDPQMRLELMSRTPTARIALATISSKPQMPSVPPLPGEEECFEYTKLSDNHQIGITPIEGPPAPLDALNFDISLARRLRVKIENLDLVPASFYTPLAQLTALRLRLSKVSNHIEVLTPMTGPRWAYRPALPRTEDGPADLRDIAAGLNMLLNPAHQAAARPDALTVPDILKDLELSALPLMSEPATDNGTMEHGFSVQDTSGQQVFMPLWHWSAMDETWSQLASGSTKIFDMGDRFLLILPGTDQGGMSGLSSADDERLYNNFKAVIDLENNAVTFANAKVALADIRRLSIAIASADDPETLQVVAHHGNLPGAPWGEEKKTNDD